jgi:WD40 repeat protein
MRLVSSASLGLTALFSVACTANVTTCTGDDPCDNGTSGPAQQLVQGGDLQAISPDQSWMAYLQNQSAGGVNAGDLMVAPTGTPGQARRLSQNAYSAAFSTDSHLFFLTDPQASIDANSTATYGRLDFWMPDMTSATQLSNGFASIHVNGPGNTYSLFWDQPGPSLAAPADVKLARASDCGGTGCSVTTLLAAVAGVSTTSISPDGRFAAFTARQGQSGHVYDAYLVDVAGLVITQVVNGGSGNSISFSSDGSLFAAVGPGGALRVFDSATATQVGWSTLPAQASVVQVAFSDPDTLVLRAMATGAKQADAWVTTATTSSQLATGVNGLGVYRSTVSGGRWAVLSHDYASGTGSLEAYDLTVASPAPITVASSSGYGTLSLSPDGLYLRVLENYDPVAGVGDLTVVSLPDGQSQNLASEIASASASFLGGAHDLGYFDGNGKLTVWNDSGSTDLADGVVDWRARGSSATLYFTVGDAGDSIYGYASGIYAQPAP